MAAAGEFTGVTRRLGCLRGICTLSGFALATEIGDWSRFSGSSIGAYLGLVPSENSSGTRVQRGPITRAGNTHARRLLIEAAWHHTPNYVPGVALRKRWELLGDPQVALRGDKGNRRLAGRRRRLQDRNVEARKINTAIARELAGWCWSPAVTDRAAA
ncbi:MAG: transposase [Gordonia sp. (in: high G+C Gram-positive bacteria)]